MCNHGLEPDHVHAHAHSSHYVAWHHERYNAISLTGAAVNTNALAGGAAAAESPAYTSSEMWLKVAPIAVPVCGVIILVVLVAAVVRILRRVVHERGAATFTSKVPLTQCNVTLLPSADEHHHWQLHHRHNHHQEAERYTVKNEANHTAPHVNLFRGTEAGGAGPAGKPPAELYHKVDITWHAEADTYP